MLNRLSASFTPTSNISTAAIRNAQTNAFANTYAGGGVVGFAERGRASRAGVADDGAVALMMPDADASGIG